MDNDEALARCSYWNQVRTKSVKRCTHKAEDDSLVCNKCWDDFCNSTSGIRVNFK